MRIFKYMCVSILLLKTIYVSSLVMVLNTTQHHQEPEEVSA